MAAMFLAMVWHARRRLAAMEEPERVSMENLRLLEREQRFVQDASHELRTPITVALGHAELIQRSADRSHDRGGRGRDRRRADAAAASRRPPAPARRQRGSRSSCIPRPVDLETILMDAVRRWTATPRRWLLGAAEEATVIADADRLEAALDALIENAVNHTQEQDTIEVAIHRRGARGGDLGPRHGSGDPAADLDHIFDRFARADPGRSRHTGGFGLGLSDRERRSSMPTAARCGSRARSAWERRSRSCCRSRRPPPIRPSARRHRRWRRA